MRKSLFDYAQRECSWDQIEKAKKYAQETQCSPQKALKETAALSEERLLELMGEMYRMPVAAELSKLHLDPELAQRFDKGRLAELKMIPCSYQEVFTAAIVNPNSYIAAEDYIREVFGRGVKVECVLVSEPVYIQYIGTQERVEVHEVNIQDYEVYTETDEDVYNVSDEDSSSIVSLVNKIFSDAAINQASDIHIEPMTEHTRVRFRVDGMLYTHMTYPRKIHKQIVNRIKTMANMNVNNSRIAQGGRIRLQLETHQIDMRISTLPANLGEAVTARVLDVQMNAFDISIMEMAPEVERKLKNVLHIPSGITLVTGPTGSGKSSSLYGIMTYLNDASRCIITLENPVEYVMDGLVQVPIQEEIGLTFDRAFREVLRQDPNIVLVGEIRDVETARTAAAASNTGHQVFSTLHTNSAASAVMRLLQMGVEPYLLSDTLNAVINQRLVRRLCPYCREQYLLTPESKFYGLFERNDVVLYRSRGCAVCGGRGYRGRIAVQELLVITDAIRELISANATTGKIQLLAETQGMKTIQQDGIEKALAGVTTLEEIHREIHFDNLEGEQ